MNGAPPPVPSKSLVKHWNLGIGPILSHAFNHDNTLLAVSSAEKVFIFSFDGGNWKQIYELPQHDFSVTGLDWAAETNRLVSCSHDKNSFVWTVGSNCTFKPELVLLRSQHGLSCVKWSPRENKFTVGTHARHLSVCYYEKENDWWVAKQIKKSIDSTILCIDWHPNNVMVVAGTTDFRVLVFSTYIKEVDDKPAPNPWGSKLPFGILLAEFVTCGWVHSVAFSPSGNQLAWSTRGSEINIVNKTNGAEAQPVTVQHKFLPFTSLLWIDETSFIGIGHEYSPILFDVVDGKAVFRKKIGAPAVEKENMQSSAFKMFRNIDRTAATQDTNDSRPNSLHQNAVKTLKRYATNPKGVTKFSTSGLDGIIAVWDLKGSA
ncbi:Actin-related protein 2/3 complex subunit [Aphelenchoides besseyi]|nr:Actin-related protein 2/3 complex subunit [Aphelenchoides besseyi]KAI6201244.1 Actin-related protein 2/3 complex subunit [Aphelenchoides besseyi]